MVSVAMLNYQGIPSWMLQLQMGKMDTNLLIALCVIGFCHR
jgi:hypothetical protein